MSDDGDVSARPTLRPGQLPGEKGRFEVKLPIPLIHKLRGLADLRGQTLSRVTTDVLEYHFSHHDPDPN